MSIQALLTVLTFSRNGSRDYSNHAVALAEQIQLSGLVQGEPQIDPARTSYGRGSRQVGVLPAARVVLRLYDRGQSRKELSAAIGRICRVVPPDRQLVNRRLGERIVVVSSEHLFEVGVPETSC